MQVYILDSFVWVFYVIGIMQKMDSTQKYLCGNARGKTAQN